jgi:hypothetical protein
MVMDNHWFNADPRLQELVDRMIAFFADEHARQGQNYAVHEMDGAIASQWASTGQNAMNGTVAMVTGSSETTEFTESLWRQPMPRGK